MRRYGKLSGEQNKICHFFQFCTDESNSAERMKDELIREADFAENKTKFLKKETRDMKKGKKIMKKEKNFMKKGKNFFL